eukprot:TRINITY_DN1205_c0_g1_i2.p1 TRINITY_DN1205_c0_g1~~TRINITY_DN1205_c0_g1_i2.p1  ORF type:complete len:224 (+),score=42.39 TRINITY_DN1205_c0_g1_i2:134-805(+)
MRRGPRRRSSIIINKEERERLRKERFEASAQREKDFEDAVKQDIAAQHEVDKAITQHNETILKLERQKVEKQKELAEARRRAFHFSGGRIEGVPLIDGLYTGSGRFYGDDDRLIYNGEFLESIKQGMGTIYWRNGNSWKGKFKANQLHGWGLYTRMTDSRKQPKRYALYKKSERIGFDSDFAIGALVNVRLKGKNQDCLVVKVCIFPDFSLLFCFIDDWVVFC